MKEGYIVWNQTAYGDGFEFFGVYKSRKAAERQLRKVIRNRFGKCPRNLDDLIDFVDSQTDGEDSYSITPFYEHFIEGE